MNFHAFRSVLKDTSRLVTLALAGLLAGYFGGVTPLVTAQVAPFQGLGNVQFLDNNGVPLTSGVLYSYQAGTTTQQATFTDSSGTIANPNPIPFGSGARVSIWLTAGQFYKFVLCAQNDGAFCSPGDVLFTEDQVPGSPIVSSTGSTFTGTFISGSASPASTGILRLSTGDVICWRNQADTANLCIRKDTNDVLSWDGGNMKFPEVNCSLSAIGFDYLCPDSSLHRWVVFMNGGSKAQLVVAGQDINSSDQVTKVHFGATAAPFCSTAPSLTTQFIGWNGTQLCPAVPSFTAPASVISYVRKEMASDVAVPVNTSTTLATQSVTMPASGCPCRALVAWNIGIQTASSGGFSAAVNDGSNSFAFSQGNATGSVGGNVQIGISASGWSHVTYANNQVVSFNLKTEGVDTGYTVKKSASEGIVQNSGMDITIFSSN